MNNSQVAHQFVYGNNANSENLQSVDGRFIYYTTIIAEKKEGFFLFDSSRFSSRTSQIQSKFNSAVQGNKVVFAFSRWGYQSFYEDVNLTKFRYKIESLKEKHGKARQPGKYAGELLTVNVQIMELIELMKWETLRPLLLTTDETLTYAEQVNQYQNAISEKERVRQEQYEAQRTAYEAGQLAVYGPNWKEEKERIRKENQEKELAESLLLWRNGEHNSVPYSNRQFLRLRDGKIETSLSVSVEVDEALKLWSSLLYCKDSGFVGCEPTSVYSAVMRQRYSVTAITPELVRIGCHTFDWLELENAYALISK